MRHETLSARGKQQHYCVLLFLQKKRRRSHSKCDSDVALMKYYR